MGGCPPDGTAAVRREWSELRDVSLVGREVHRDERGSFSKVFDAGGTAGITATQTGALFGRVHDTNTNNSGSFLVDLTAVPEPATWAMMLLGFGMVGLGLRSRRHGKVTATVAYA